MAPLSKLGRVRLYDGYDSNPLLYCYSCCWR